ncbi:hypothetical protein KYC5002_43640 [Archangium violaceum]|uniref:hypothetical protein n=1 Tax=Archangium violaceum TaxID=83451 RepID=UPI002B2E4FBB|nr:hypothetical protein KYC5002_43640 [Archangium gephyra]
MSSDPSAPSPSVSAPPTPGRHLGWLVGVGCGVAVLALTFALAPEYWRARGFPLDDAWIHAVYARSVARGDWLSYNPGVPATGETSPLWAFVVSVAHLGEASVGRAVLVTKLLGFLLHALTAAGLYAVLRGAGRLQALSAALVVLVSPHLVGASISGMEVPLATLAAVGFVLVLRSQRPWLYALCGALGPLARPEVGVFLVLLPLVVRPQPGWRPVVRRWLEAAAGLVLGGGAWAAWNLSASGRPLPATFYAKVTSSRAPLLPALFHSHRVGYSELLPEVSWPGPVLLVLVALALLTVWRRQSASNTERLAAGLVAVGLAFCSVSLALGRMGQVESFYAQRYVLPALPFLLAALPVLLGGWLERRLASHGPRIPALAVAVLPLVMATGLAPRLARLENDAHNIDDLQVQEGLFLSHASPGDVVWVLDAGASRFFGNAFVVDLLGLNTPQMLEKDAQAWLTQHPPRFLEWTKGWAAIQPDDKSGLRIAGTFQTSTEYTVSHQKEMGTRLLMECGPGVGGVYARKSNRWRYACAAAPSARPVVEDAQP